MVNYYAIRSKQQQQQQQQQHSSREKGHSLDCVCCNVCAPGHGEALLLPQGQSLLPHPHRVPAASLRKNNPSCQHAAPVLCLGVWHVCLEPV
jgi:hypothetical protein